MGKQSINKSKIVKFVRGGVSALALLADIENLRKKKTDFSLLLI